MKKITPCPNCHSTKLYMSRPVGSGGGHAPDYLPGLGKTFSSAKFSVVLCTDCGLTRLFAQIEATRKVSESKKWERIPNQMIER